MGWADNFLSRFCRAGTPGAAARAGVPVDRAAEAAAELQAALSLLAGTESACSEIRQQAEADAEELRERARATAAALVAEARGRARSPPAATPCWLAWRCCDGPRPGAGAPGAP